MNTKNQKEKQVKSQEPSKYRDLISQSEGEMKSEQLQLDVQKAKSGLEVSIAQTKLELANARQRLAEAKRANPYSIETEITAIQAVLDLEQGLEYAESVLEERF